MTDVSSLPTPPTAEQRRHSYQAHGVMIEERLFWANQADMQQIGLAQSLDLIGAL